MKRCPECGTIAADETKTCGACGGYRRNISDESASTAAATEEVLDALDERALEKEDLSNAWRIAYHRITAAVGGIACFVGAIVAPDSGPRVPFPSRYGIANAPSLLFIALIGMSLLNLAVSGPLFLGRHTPKVIRVSKRSRSGFTVETLLWTSDGASLLDVLSSRRWPRQSKSRAYFSTGSGSRLRSLGV